MIMASTISQVVATKVITHEYQWRILNWLKVQETRESIYSQKIVVQTGGQPHKVSKWEIGFMAHPTAGTHCQLYCKLIHTPRFTDKLECTINIQYLQNNNTVWKTFSKECKIKKEQCLQTCVRFDFPINKSDYYVSLVDTEGALNFKINIKVMIPKLLDFTKTLVAQLHNNFAALLKDCLSADVTLVTRDGIQLPAHQFILKVRCPVLASTFRSHFAEGATGNITVEDISGKTMKILLHFFYTGELLSTWFDEDTIVEFTYAAGKYQMAEVLRMLDSVLGTTDENDSSSFDLQLLKVAHKLSLKNAEARLVKRVMKKTAKIESAEELLEFLGKICICNNSPDNLLVRANT